ncbi:hypothetical protein ES703_122865 [subsurface metagenome]
MDERWKVEARRVFPYIGIPRSERARQAPQPEKFTAFTLTDPPGDTCDDRVLAEIYDDMKGRETIIDLLKFYSDELMEHPDADSPYFTKLHELFNRGKSFREIRGFYRGALVTCRGQGLLEIFDLNILNMVWGLARLFTPWTGKTFEDITTERLREITDGHETGELPTFWPPVIELEDITVAGMINRPGTPGDELCPCFIVAVPCLFLFRRVL